MAARTILRHVIRPAGIAIAAGVLAAMPILLLAAPLQASAAPPIYPGVPVAAPAYHPPPAPTSNLGATTVKVTVRVAANLRAGPGTGYSRIGGVPAGQIVEIKARNTAGDWYQLANGAWILGDLLASRPVVPVAANLPSPARPTSPAATGPAGVAVKVRTGANLRAGPGTNYPKVGGAAAGQALTIVAQNQAGDWYQTGAGAWIFGELLESRPKVPVARGAVTATAPASPAPTLTPAATPVATIRATVPGPVQEGGDALPASRTASSSILQFVFARPLAVIIPAVILLALIVLGLGLGLRRITSTEATGYPSTYGRPLRSWPPGVGASGRSLASGDSDSGATSSERSGDDE